MKHKVGKPRNPLVQQLIKESQGSGCHETRKELQERKFQQESKLTDAEIKALNEEFDEEQALSKSESYWDSYDTDWDYDMSFDDDWNDYE